MPPPIGGQDAGVLLLDSTHGARLALHDLGGEGPPVLWCHATGFHGRCYRPVADAVPGRHHWAIDFRGFGDSTEGDALPEWARFGEDVLAVVDHLGLSGADAVGHSKGGAALLMAELARPGTFARLFCFEPIVFPSPDAMPAGGNPLADAARRRRPWFDSAEAAIERYGAKPPLDALDPRCLERYVVDGTEVRDDGRAWLKATPAWEAATFEHSLHDTFTRLGEVATTVVVGASGDGFGPALVAPAVAEALPHGSLRSFPDLGHFGPLEDPDGVGAAIAETFA